MKLQDQDVPSQAAALLKLNKAIQSLIDGDLTKTYDYTNSAANELRKILAANFQKENK